MAAAGINIYTIQNQSTKENKTVTKMLQILQ